MHSLFMARIIIVQMKEIYFTVSFYTNKLLTHSPFIFVVVYFHMLHISLCLDLTLFSRLYSPLMI